MLNANTANIKQLFGPESYISRNEPQILLVKKLLQPIRRPTLIWVVTRHQYGISALVSQTSFPAGNQWWRPEMSAVLPDTTRVAFITNIKIGTRLNKRIGLLVSMIFTESNKRTISVWLRFIFCIYFKGILSGDMIKPKVCLQQWNMREIFLAFLRSSL